MTELVDEQRIDAVDQVDRPAAAGPVVDRGLVGELVERARAGGLALTGQGGLLQQLTKVVLEAALDGEITDHLGYDKHAPPGVTVGTPVTGPARRRC